MPHTLRYVDVSVLHTNVHAPKLLPYRTHIALMTTQPEALMYMDRSIIDINLHTSYLCLNRHTYLHAWMDLGYKYAHTVLTPTP